MIQQAVIIGIPVFVEKPITCTLKEGMDIVQVASEQNIQVGVNYQYRYDSGCYALVRAVQTGNLGEIYYARCNIPWYRDLNYFKDSGWHSNLTSSCGGTLLTQGSHILDIALWALGGKPTSAFGVISQKKFKDVEVEDLALGTIEMNNGALIQISSSMIANPEQAISIEVYGEIGTALYTDKPLPKVRFRGANLKKEKPPVWGIHALQRSLEAYRLWVMDNKPYLTPAREALPVLAAIEALYRSAKSGQKEQVEILSD